MKGSPTEIEDLGVKVKIRILLPLIRSVYFYFVSSLINSI